MTEFYCTQVDLTKLCWDITLLGFAMLNFTQLLSARLCCALLGYNFALLYYAPLRYDTLLFTQLCWDITLLFSTTP